MRKFVSAIMVVVIAVLIIIGLFAGILAVKADAAQDYPLKIYEQNNLGPYYRTLLVIDEATGVNYVVMRFGESISITPRLNADGSLYVSK